MTLAYGNVAVVASSPVLGLDFRSLLIDTNQLCRALSTIFFQRQLDECQPDIYL